jgi:hypothetical protein
MKLCKETPVSRVGDCLSSNPHDKQSIPSKRQWRRMTHDASFISIMQDVKYDKTHEKGGHGLRRERVQGYQVKDHSRMSFAN